MPKLVLQGVTKLFGMKKVLDHISLKINEGEAISLIGPSGSGKSTLLRSINRLTDINDGEIPLNDISIYKMDPIVLRQKVCMVFQIPAMFEGSVQENVEYGLKIQNIRDPTRIKQAMIDAGLSAEFLTRNTSKLSVGEQQRVAIARTLALNPEILLLDEPTASLDPELTQRFEATIDNLMRIRDLTIIWVTHDMPQAQRVGDKIAILDGGRIKNVEKTNGKRKEIGIKN